MVADVELMTEDGEEDWIAKASRESNEALAKRGAERPAKGEKPAKAEKLRRNDQKGRAVVFDRAFVKKKLADGKYRDLGTPHLYLIVKGNARSYAFRYKRKLTGKEEWLGLGSVARDLHDVQDVARKYNKWLADGKDPLLELAKEEKKAVLTNEVIDKYFQSKIAHLGTAEEHKRHYLGNYIRPLIGNVPIALVSREMIQQGGWGPDGLTFEELWIKKHQTAVRVRMHLQRIFDYADEVMGCLPKNLITSRWFSALLPKRKTVHRVEHHDPLPYLECYAFVQALRASRDCNPQKMKYWSPAAQKYAWVRPFKAMVIEFQFYCSVRHKEIRVAKWREVNWEELTWTPPWQNTKNKIERAIPISPPMLEILEECRRLQGGNIDPAALIFPGSHGKPITASAVATFVRRSVDYPRKVDPHASRSTLRDWTRAKGYDDVLWKIQVDHVLGGESDRAYGHDKQLEPRRKMIAAYAKHCTTPPKQAEIISLKRKRL